MPDPNNIVLLDPEGRPHEMDVDSAARTLESPGWRVQTDDDRRSRLADEAREETYGGIRGQIGAGLAAGARGLSYGGSDAIISAAGGGEELRQLRAANPGISTGLEIAGSLVAPGGSLGTAARASKAAATTTGKIARVAAQGIEQNIAQGIGQTVTDVALSENPLEIEQIGSSLLRNVGTNVVVGAGVNLAGAAAGKALRAAKGKLDDVAARGEKIGKLGEEVSDDLSALDAKGLRQAEKAELEAIEQTRVPQREQVAEEIKAHRTTAKQDKIFLATKDAKTWEGVDEALKKEVREVGKVSLEADKAIDRALRNPKALASRPQRALDALQQQESALEKLLTKRAELEDVFKADTSGARKAALDSAERALQRNREIQAKIADLGTAPTSARLDNIVSARDALTTGGKESFAQKMAGGTAYGVGASVASAIPFVGGFLAPFAGAAASNAITGKLGGKLVAAQAEAAKRASSAVDMFLNVGRRVAPVAPVLATKVLAAYRYTDRNDKTEAKAPKKVRLAAAYKARTDEIKQQTAYQMGVPKMRPEARQRIATKLAPIALTNPVLADRLETLAARKVEYLASKLPRRPDIASVKTGPDTWQPSDFEMRSFARTIAAVEDPQGIVERLADGTVTPEDAEAMRAVYPEMMADITRQILERLPELQKQLPYERRLALSIFTGAPVDPAMDTRVLSVLQRSFTEEPGTEGGTQAPVAQPAFGSVKAEAATPAQQRST